MKQIILATVLAAVSVPAYAGTLYQDYNGDFVICSQREGTASCFIQWITGQ